MKSESDHDAHIVLNIREFEAISERSFQDNISSFNIFQLYYE